MTKTPSIFCCAGLPTLLAVAVMSTVPHQPASANEPVPNLEGIWAKTDGQIRYWDGQINTFPQSYEISQIEITDQEGAVFEAYQSSVAIEGAQQGRHGTEPISSDRLPMLGVIDWDGVSVRIADIGDTTAYECTLVDDDTMYCTLWEAGDHALAGRVVLERE
ncbi:MAG: hypothetical protein AAF414_20130 [Pseudomonadota bacterium]